MRIKTILSLTTFFTAFVLSVLLVGVPRDNSYARYVKVYDAQETSQSIQALLDQDVSNGTERSETVSSLSESARDGDEFDYAELASATENYADASQSIDDSDLPADFQIAWHNHMSAWRERANYLNRVSETGGQINSCLNHRQSAKIGKTYAQVLRVAESYGVDISGY